MHQSPEIVWDECLDLVRENISRQSFKTWFEPLKALKLEEDGECLKLTVQLPSRFYYEWLEEHYFGLLRKTITQVLGPQGRLYYHIAVQRDDPENGQSGSPTPLPAQRPTADLPPEQPPIQPWQRSHTQPTPPATGQSGRMPVHRVAYPASQPQRGYSAPVSPEPAPVHPFAIPGIKKTPVESQLNASYTFDRFIEGDCNRLARSAALAIAQRPGTTSFNPFLIYGGVGLGKTHLIHAVGNYAKENRLVDSVLYISSERFTTEFVQSIQHNRVNEFSQFYRQVDLLIVDDVQFFGGKEKTQEEFFHIFNTLHQSGKQIILSSDRPPRDIAGIEERLLSRFGWGLSADVQAPELETRIAILHRKADYDGIDLPHDVIEFIAHNVKSNIRELEGALIRLLAHATLHRREIDLALAKEVLRDLFKDTRVNLSIEEIQRIVCEYFKIPEDLVRAKTRKREVVQARQVAMFFSKQLTQHSLKTIGLHFGGRDHSTVIHANQSVENQMETDSKFREMMDEIRHTIELRSR
jgi:chromosomal replication initiator protein